jgi:hypothetical protein
MKLYLSNATLVVDTSVVNGERTPESHADRVVFVKDAISEANRLLARAGIKIQAFVEASDIRGDGER